MNDGRRRRRLFTVNAELPPYVSLTAGVLALVACPVKRAPKVTVTGGVVDLFFLTSPEPAGLILDGGGNLVLEDGGRLLVL